MSETTGFFGVPFSAWGLVCLALAAVWIVVWPADRVVGAGVLRYVLVRWGHSVCWLMLAAMCFLRTSGSPTLAGVGNLMGLASLVAYLAFMAAAFLVG